MRDEKTAVVAKSSAMLTSNLLSSPPRLPPSRGKERRNPSITPRKFKRFFTPRDRPSSRPSAAGRALRDITAAPALNRRFLTPSSPLKPIAEDLVLFESSQESLSLDTSTQQPSKRRKVHHAPELTPRQLPTPLKTSPVIPESPSRSPRLRSPLRSFSSSQSSCEGVEFDYDLSDDEHNDVPKPAFRPVPLTRRGLSGQIFQRMTGGMPRSGYSRLPCPVSDWKTETANFYTRPQDLHMCISHEGAARCIPFCTASCNSNSLIAVGDEEGYVRLLDSDQDFEKTHLTFRAHTNAVIDLAFSEDDSLLASASGDQTGRVIDMMTQTPIAILSHHTASLKQVRFQPGQHNNSVLATSSRDGSVQIWDLRCHGGPVQEVPSMVRDSALTYRAPRQVKSGCVVNSLYDAHGRVMSQPRTRAVSALGDVARVNEVPGRLGEVSVTALQFLPQGQEHLLLTACEADATIKLWDIRSIYSSRMQKSCTPISYTATPESHASWRPFGISSMALSSDGARLFSVCKDNTVYAYSTAHLVLGHAPELTPVKHGELAPRRKHYGSPQEGLAPLYGFRHPQFHATSFYVKAAIRPAGPAQTEMLAVGSSDGCAVLFPTDERYMRAAWDAAATTSDSSTALLEAPLLGPGPPTLPGRPGLRRANSGTHLSGRVVDTIPIATVGTALVRGHEKEVGALTWTHGGKLVTVGDDYMVRCWSEDRERAADLRTGGEGQGRRWASGWADVGEDWEGDQDDW